MIPPFSFNLNSLITNTYYISKSASSDAASNAYSWVKPPGTGMVYIFILAPGGNGYSVPAGTNEGGGGGSGGRYFTIITPAMFLPDALKIQGPTAANNFVRILDPETGFVIAAVGAGGDSTGISGGTATVGTSAAVPGLFRGDGGGGLAGVSGGASGLPGTDLFIGNNLSAGGAGGGGTNAAGTSAASGGAVYVSSVVDVYPYPNLVSAAAGTAGSNGYTFLSPLAVVTPGAGGGGGLIRGGDGGDGGLGQGGGGGGGNTTGQGPSRGGKGGPGIVIIYSW